MIRKAYDSLLSLAYPQACQICQQDVEKSFNGVACADCWKRTGLFSGDETACHKCSNLLSDRPGAGATYCHRCDDHLYDLARAAGRYEHALAASILALKRTPLIAGKLQNIFTEGFRQTSFAGDITLIVPVPLSRRRRLERGFNQAGLLAALLATETSLPLDEKSFVRTKHTTVHRAGMDRKGRALSVAKSFVIKRRNMIEGETVLLVDDVFTSGATASACAEALKKNGADKVYVYTLARTV